MTTVPEPTEVSEAETLAEILYDHAGSTRDRAPLGILLHLPYALYARQDFRDRYLVLEERSEIYGTVRWYRLADDLATGHCVPLSPGERAAVSIACALAVQTSIDLGDALIRLDRHNRELVQR
jgi:hypothetical protein